MHKPWKEYISGPDGNKPAPSPGPPPPPPQRPLPAPPQPSANRLMLNELERIAYALERIANGLENHAHS